MLENHRGLNPALGLGFEHEPPSILDRMELQHLPRRIGIVTDGVNEVRVQVLRCTLGLTNRNRRDQSVDLEDFKDRSQCIHEDRHRAFVIPERVEKQADVVDGGSDDLELDVAID